MPNAEDLLIRQHACLVRKLALQLLASLPANVDLDDLIQAGMLGLLDATRRYQEMPEAQFQTYATTRIRGAMLDELRNQDWLPRSVRAKSRRIERAVSRLEQSLGRAPTECEIAQTLGVHVETYRQLLMDAQGVHIVHHEDFIHHDEDDPDWHERVVPANTAGDPLSRLLARDLRTALIQAINDLPEREKLMLSLYYEQNLNLKEIGAVMGVTEGRVCQLRNQATARIRARLHKQAWQQPSDDLALLLQS